MRAAARPVRGSFGKPGGLRIATTAHAESPAGTTRLEIDDNHLVRELVGENRRNLKAIEAALRVGVAVRGNLITISGEPAARQQAAGLVEQFVGLLEKGYPLSSDEVAHAASLAAGGQGGDLRGYMLDTILLTSRRKPIAPRSPNQKRYVDAMRRCDVVFGLGPAGTGKTYLAVAMAVAALQAGDVRRIILTRPAVEAGEKLGFLPGDLVEKINPYLRPLYDALHDMMDPAKTARLIEQGTIEIAPLAFMRGRTLNQAFVILDEAQNSTREQMKMLLTRLGLGSKAVVTGDLSQTDLVDKRGSGLLEVRRILSGIDEIPFVEFERGDVVRHPLVRRILRAYDEADAERESRRPSRRAETQERA